MAAPQRIIALNIGTQKIGIAEFHASAGGGLILNAIQSTELPASESSEAGKKTLIQAGIVELMHGIRANGAHVNYALTAQSVFTRFVKLPAVAEDKIDQIIEFEAQQNVPFPIEEVVWDYQLVGGGDESKLEVVLVAIKSDLLNEVNSAVEDAGLKTSIVDVAPMALYNAFRYNYSDLGGCSLLIDIGARTTNLIFLEPKKVFSRSIPLGGNAISSAIAKELSVTFQQAERRKRDKGYVSLGGAYAEDVDPDVAKMSKIIRNTMTKLHAEIARSISFYRAQQQGSQPARVFLCGGSANLPYMREFFSEKLQTSIEFFNPLRNVAVAGGIEMESLAKHVHEVGELVGLGLRSSSDCPMELNLRPDTVIRQQRLDARKPYLLLAALGILLGLAGWAFYFHRGAEIKGEVLERVKAKVVQLSGFQTKLEQVGQEIKKLEAAAQPLTLAASERQFWPELLDDIHNRLPDRYIWITSLEPAGEKSAGQPASGNFAEPAKPPTPATGAVGASRIEALRLKGLYLGNPPNPKQQAVVDLFVQKLQESPFVAERPQVVKRATPTDTEWAYEFELQVKLKQPLSLQP